MTRMPAVTALPTVDGMGLAVIFMIVDVEDAGSGSVPRALVMVRDELLCFLDLWLKAVVGGGGCQGTPSKPCFPHEVQQSRSDFHSNSLCPSTQTSSF